MAEDSGAPLGAQMKSLTVFSHHVLQDLGDRCHISTGRDFETVTARVEHEGLSFLAIALPKYGKDFQKGLDRGFLAPDSFAGFRRWKGLPRFLGGFLELVFDRETGRLLEFPDENAILAVHQFTSMYGKILSPVSEKRLKTALAGFVQCEQDVRESDAGLTSEFLKRFTRVGSMLFRDVFTEVDRKVFYGELIPKHGSGATAERLTSNGKYNSKLWTRRLEEVFPSGEYLFPNWGWYHQAQSIDILEPGAEIPVRVITVPKTLKSPRVIGIEPTCMQYMQQAVFEALTQEMEKSDSLSILVGHLDQSLNRDLAKLGSITGALATLDLSEASDRVSNQLVRALLTQWPHLRRAVDASRSRSADVPGHGVIRLAKFASMGSALCFPFEGYVFLTLIFMSVEQELNRRLRRSDVSQYLRRVRVYGDDIIVPTDLVNSVIGNLEAAGLKVNHDKSFWTGKFRESCGGDYFNGRWVTPIRVKKVFPTSRKHVAEIVSTSALRNQLFEAGYERSVEYLDGLLKDVLFRYPEVPRTSSAIGRWTHSPIQAERVHPHLQKPLIKAPVVVDRFPRDYLEDYGALMKWFLKRGSLPIADRDHLQRAGRPVSADIKTRWVPSE